MSTWLKEVVTIDFETEPIQDRPDYPPKPVGVALKMSNEKAKYFSFSHPSENNSTFQEARKAVGEILDSDRPLLFHNAKFDLCVLEKHFKIKLPTWDRVHDTLPMLFLRDPHAGSFALKPASENILGLKQTEKDDLLDWLIEKQPIKNKRLTLSKNGNNYAGAYVCAAPGSLAGKYAVGDVERTYKIAKKVWPEILERKMEGAYNRERQLLFVIMGLEDQGVRVDFDRLERDIKKYDRCLASLDQWLFKKLKLKEGINLNSNDQLVKALLDAGLADQKDFNYTEKGNIQTSKDSLSTAIKDQQLLSCFMYRSQLCTCLNTFMRPWFLTAQRSKGLIFTTWNSTRGEYGGARTGRLSSSPNFQNIPKLFDPLFKEWDHKAMLPSMPIKLAPLPLVRSYIVPLNKGDVLLDRDYSQQELRVLGHFEDGVLCEAYQKNPSLDVHKLAQDMINKMLSSNFNRSIIKTTGFGLIYGMGVGRLAEKTGVDVETAKMVKAAYLKVFPGLDALYNDMRYRAQHNLPIRTWGGREYYCEPPKEINGRFCTFDYKMVNVLVQGSSSDITKEAMIRFSQAKGKNHKLLSSVHDEILVSAPKNEAKVAMRILKEAMEGIALDVPLLSDGKMSSKNWSLMKGCA